MNSKKEYVAPSCDTYAISLEGVLAASNDVQLGATSFGNPFGETPDEVEW